MGTKKRLNDMPPDWHARHNRSPIPSDKDWCRQVGILPMATPSEEQVSEAWEDFRDIGTVTALVQDLIDDTNILLNSKSTTVVQAEMLKRVSPYIKAAYEQLRKASQTAVNMGLFANGKCKRCSAPLVDGRCTDESCAYSNHPQSWNEEAE